MTKLIFAISLMTMLVLPGCTFPLGNPLAKDADQGQQLESGELDGDEAEPADSTAKECNPRPLFDNEDYYALDENLRNSSWTVPEDGELWAISSCGSYAICWEPGNQNCRSFEGSCQNGNQVGCEWSYIHIRSYFADIQPGDSFSVALVGTEVAYMALQKDHCYKDPQCG